MWRVSSKSQEDGTSLEAQAARIASYCKDHGYELADIVSEVKSAGVNDGEVFSWENRPRLIELMEQAKNGHIDALIVYKFDRVSRDNASLTILKRQLQRTGTKLISTAEQNGDSAQARLLENTMAAFAEYERELIRERMRLGKAQRKSEGRHVHGQPPDGFVSSGGILAPHEVEAPVVQSIYSMAADGMAAGRIARRLNRQGTPPRSAASWSAATIRNILRNPAHAGERYGKKTAHERIVSRQLWNRVQQATC